MKLRPCIDIHNGKVKQIVGSSLQDAEDQATANFVAEQDAKFFADLYHDAGLTGGHVILLNAQESSYYQDTKKQALEALKAWPGEMQIGGGITPQNAKDFLTAGASHVIVTSYVFRNGTMDMEHLAELVKAVGVKRLVLDLSCAKIGDNYYIVTDRWQKITDTVLNEQTMEQLAGYCDEFLIHAADVEGRQNGIEENVVALMGNWGKKPMTYAGGVHSLQDIHRLKAAGHGKLDVTVGSALKIFGGSLELSDIIAACKEKD